MFIDEVQNVPEFEKLLEGLYVHTNIDLPQNTAANLCNPPPRKRASLVLHPKLDRAYSMKSSEIYIDDTIKELKAL